MKRVDQLLAGYAAGDAISQEARIIRKILRQAGYASDIFAPEARIAPDMRGDCRGLVEFDSPTSEFVILHYSTRSVADELFMSAAGHKVMRYHNITPVKWARGYDDAVAAELADARKGLGQIVAAADVCWSDSQYNAAELADLQPKHSVVLPLIFSPAEFAASEDVIGYSDFSDGLVNWLYVGRIATNKCIEELIEAFAWYQTINPRSRLIIVGSGAAFPMYYAMLRLLATRLELANVCFAGFVTNAEKYSIYKSASVFVTASRHEGYCLPLIEAITRGVPVVARAVGGMPEALNGAGVMFNGLDAKELAVLLDKVCSDGALREEILASQQRRLDEIAKRDAARELLGLINGPETKETA